jgi:hypothetical protein
MPMSDDVEKGIIAGIFGLAGTLIPAAIEWLHLHDVHAARLRKLDEACKRVTFWDQWLKLSVQIADPTDAASIQKIEKELVVLGHILESDSYFFHEELTRQQNTAEEYNAMMHALPFWRRWPLFYAPMRSVAWFPRILFFLGVFSLGLFILSEIMTRINIWGFTIIEFMLVVWIVTFRALSKWLEQPPHGNHPTFPHEAPTHTPPPPPLEPMPLPSATQ